MFKYENHSRLNNQHNWEYVEWLHKPSLCIKQGLSWAFRKKIMIDLGDIQFNCRRTMSWLSDDVMVMLWTSLGFRWEEERRRLCIDSVFEAPHAIFFESSRFLVSSSFWVKKNLRVSCVLCWILLLALWRLYRKMRPISREKEENIVALIEKGRRSREIAKSVGLAQSK